MRGWIAAGGLVLVGGFIGIAFGAGPIQAIELCSTESREMMREARISQKKIDRLCQLAGSSGALFSLSLKRSEEELGYCRVTLALQNHSAFYLNHMSLNTTNGRFEIFKFRDIIPGGTGYANARSRILLGCDELGEVGIGLFWPGSVRVGEMYPRGKRMERFKPALKSRELHWERVQGK